MNPRTSRRSRWLWLFIPIIALIGTILLIMSRNSSTPPGDPLAGARAKAFEAAQGLDILQVEYPKTLRGEASGAAGAFNRARDTFKAAQGDLAKIDSAAASQLAADFDSLQQKFDSKAAADEVVILAQKMQSALLALAKAK